MGLDFIVCVHLSLPSLLVEKKKKKKESKRKAKEIPKQ